MAQKQFLHELLKEDQEPFRLKTYISDRRSQLKKPPPPTLHLRKRNPNNILCKRACFFSFQSSPDVIKSPFLDFQSPAKSPLRSPNAAVFLHIPSRTAALLVEAAMRIQKHQQQSRPKAQTDSKTVGLGLLGSFLKRLKDRSKTKKRAIGDSDFKVDEENVRLSCHCSNRRLSSANWTENNEDKSLDFEASTSSCASDCSVDIRTAFCASPSPSPSPFRFNLHKSPSSLGRCTPELYSPVASPSRRVNEEKENYKSKNPDNTAQGEGEEEDKEQCSPVSVFDPPFEDAHGDANDEDDYDLECSYENVQRAQKQLLYRLRRFEKLAELDPIELERKLLEGSDDEGRVEKHESDVDDDDQSSSYGERSVEAILNHSRNMSSDMKKLVYDLIDEEKSEVVHGGNNDTVMSRICSKLDSWREVEANTIDMMIGLDFAREFGRWTKFNEQVEEISAEIEVAIYGLLVEELSNEFVYMDGQYREF